jgi:hypothetical protein
MLEEVSRITLIMDRKGYEGHSRDDKHRKAAKVEDFVCAQGNLLTRRSAATYHRHKKRCRGAKKRNGKENKRKDN